MKKSFLLMVIIIIISIFFTFTITGCTKKCDYCEGKGVLEHPWNPDRACDRCNGKGRV